MDWLAVNPHFHGTFARLGTQVGDSYHVNEDCLATLGDILAKLTVEDRTLRTFRRAMGFAQVVKKDLLPLLIGVRDDAKIVDVTIKYLIFRILLKLTVPVEYLLPMEVMLKTDVGRYTVMELNMLLSTSKEAFGSPQSTRPVINHIKTILEKETKLTPEDCESVTNCLILLRNILHIPEYRLGGNGVSLQNQILWNLFAQNIDKVLIQLISSKYHTYWGATMVQLIALMYKDQNVGTLEKLLSLWFESALSDSSEGNESNTSPQHHSSGDSSPLMTSDRTSDPSDNETSNVKRKPYQLADSKCMNNESDDSQSGDPGSSGSSSLTVLPPSTDGGTPMGSDRQSQFTLAHPPISKIRVKALSDLQSRTRCEEKYLESDGCITDSAAIGEHRKHSQELEKSQDKLLKERRHEVHEHQGPSQSEGNQSKPPGEKGELGSELSDCGYGTQQENQESNLTSSNEEDAPQQRSMKHQKLQLAIQKCRYSNGKPNMTPQERKELHRKNLIKRSHTNAMHMKALLHHTPSEDDISNLLKEFTVDFLLRGYGCLVKVLHNCLLDSGRMQIDSSHFLWLVSFFLKFATQLELDLEHISLYEELQIGIQSSGRDLKPCLRGLHLVVTSIREFVEAIEAYQKIGHLTDKDRSQLLRLQIQIAEVQDLRGLLVLLLRHYNPKVQSIQFLRDLIVTNHALLMFVENAVKIPELQAKVDLIGHIKEFGTVEVMRNYGLILEDFGNNGEFVNDCVLTMMHHVAGDLSQVSALFQPKILRALSGIWESDYELCDDWSDLIEYVLHKFVKDPSCSNMKSTSNLPDGQQVSPTSEWTQEDSNNLYWYYQQSSKSEDPIESIMNMYGNYGVHDKTRISIIQQLLLQDVINGQQFKSYMEKETMLAMSKKRCSSIYATQKSARLETAAKGGQESAQSHEEEMEEDTVGPTNDIKALKDQLESEGLGEMVIWLQSLLLEVCFVKLSLQRNLPQVEEPIPHIYSRLCQSIPLVPWYTNQEQCLQCPAFILLLHKLGFHLAGDAGRLFPCVPHFWAIDFLYQIAEKLGPIREGKLKFDVNIFKSGSVTAPDQLMDFSASPNKFISEFESSSAEGYNCGRNTCFAPSSAFKTCLSSSRLTPKPVMSYVPNWLQVVQQSKISQQSSIFTEVTSSTSGSTLSSTCTPGSPVPAAKDSNLKSGYDVDVPICDQLEANTSASSNEFENQEHTNQEQVEMDTST